MFALGSLAVIAFVCYFAVVVGVLPLTPFMYRLASLALDAGLLLALLTIIAAAVAARKHRASRSQVIVCAVAGLILLALSALALNVTRYI
jgi:hypothetical protein